MPKKANTKYTGFYWYMQAILPDLRRQGRAFANGLADVVPVARPLWKVGNNHCMFLTFSVSAIWKLVPSRLGQGFLSRYFKPSTFRSIESSIKHF